MHIPNFIVIPLTETVCGTCAKWDGARILEDSECRSMAGAYGFCRGTPNEGKKHLWQLPIKRAPETACETWSSAQ
jgi:hypothetical protein